MSISIGVFDVVPLGTHDERGYFGAFDPFPDARLCQAKIHGTRAAYSESRVVKILPEEEDQESPASRIVLAGGQR